jgi:cysteine desulfurase
MIYFDNNATTPIDPQVAKAMEPYIYEHFGNPSSNHILGFRNKMAVEKARGQIASLINCSPEEILFTSGGSESNNTAIKGVAYSFKHKGKHIVTSQIEHPAVLNPCKFLERNGYEVTYLPVDKYGMVNPADVEKAITEKTILITIMHSNNETGTLQPIEEIGTISRRHNVLFHTDAAQSLGKVTMDVQKLGVDFLTVAGHKLYAPKGIGALYIKKGIQIEPLIHGAGHENGRRAGTENVIFDVALGEACEIAKEHLVNDEVRKLTDYFYARLKESFGEKIVLNGHPEKRLPNTLNISFIGHSSLDIIEKLNNIAVSTGSACHSGLTTMSPVLKAMGVSEEVGLGAIRFSLGRFNTIEEVDEVVSQLRDIIK